MTDNDIFANAILHLPMFFLFLGIMVAIGIVLYFALSRGDSMRGERVLKDTIIIIWLVAIVTGIFNPLILPIFWAGEFIWAGFIYVLSERLHHLNKMDEPFGMNLMGIGMTGIAILAFTVPTLIFLFSSAICAWLLFSRAIVLKREIGRSKD